MTRKQEREQAFILIFEKCFRSDDINEIIEDAMQTEFYEDNEFSKQCFMGVFNHIDQIDEEISRNLSGWKIERISKVSLSILRLAIYEIIFEEEIPTSVTINEAVELAKKYATTDDSAYINGVLGTFSRSLEV